jgi:hypothetical protein
MKTCKKCNCEKEDNKFYFNKKTNSYLNTCNDCINAIRRERIKTNELARQKANASYKKWAEKNSRSEYNKKWVDENRDEWNKKRRERRNNNYSAKLKDNIRRRINECLKGDIKSNKSKSLTILGCSIQYYKSWLSFNFTDEMNWNNYGSHWHIDHVKPIDSYNLLIEDEVNQCFSWKNTIPLQKMVNLKKSSNIDEQFIEVVKIKVLNFIEQKGQPTIP